MFDGFELTLVVRCPSMGLVYSCPVSTQLKSFVLKPRDALPVKWFMLVSAAKAVVARHVAAPPRATNLAADHVCIAVAADKAAPCARRQRCEVVELGNRLSLCSVFDSHGRADTRASPRDEGKLPGQAGRSGSRHRYCLRKKRPG